MNGLHKKITDKLAVNKEAGTKEQGWVTLRIKRKSAAAMKNHLNLFL